ncbi:MAG: hypothetical protein KatS3mg082_2498 [Nitrospiraceae bacterium]|nr:MAG: hypothetical protein KatS3mg082_2498 [Nitrospiraceae bacterium]
MTRHAARVVREAMRLRADVYHLHDPELLPWVPLLRRGGAKVVYDAHEDLGAQTLSKHYLPGTLRKPVAAAVSSVEMAFARRCHAVVAANDAIARRFADLPEVVVLRNFRAGGIREAP